MRAVIYGRGAWLAFVAAAAIVVAFGACVQASGAFSCKVDSECGNSGKCETAVGFCSFADTSCASGRRFGEFAGASSERCVDSTMGQGPGSGGGDGKSPVFINQSHTAGLAVSSLHYSVTVPQGDKRYLMVTVQQSGDCMNPSPATNSVTYGGTALIRVAQIAGTKGPGCVAAPASTRSETWGLVAPAVGTNEVVVTLAAPPSSLHSAALVFNNVNQTTPVRRTASASGGDAATSLLTDTTIVSQANDLVVNTVGSGSPLNTPVSNDTVLFLGNVDGDWSLNNSGASSAPGAATVTMQWRISSPDEWQTISTSLSP